MLCQSFTITINIKEKKYSEIARNLVDYESGTTILDTVMGIRTKQIDNQTELF